jgi:hypothetical protein
MSREGKTILIVFLTLTIYSIGFLFEENPAFVFPFPLNPIVFGAIALQFSYWNRNQKSIALFVTILGLISILNNMVLWEIILPLEVFTSFVKYPILIWLQLLFGIGIIISGIYTLTKQTNLISRVLIICGIIVFPIEYFFGLNNFLVLSYLLCSISVLIDSKPTRFYLLWPLLFFLSFGEWLTYFLNK